MSRTFQIVHTAAYGLQVPKQTQGGPRATAVQTPGEQQFNQVSPPLRLASAFFLQMYENKFRGGPAAAEGFKRCKAQSRDRSVCWLHDTQSEAAEVLKFDR